MDKNPLISVIIPAYNHEAYVEEALQSVFDQTYTNIELIVINDGSKDKTGERIQNFINNQQRRVIFINKPNEGVCKTINLGLSLATGAYVALLASDDCWLPERLSLQLQFMLSNSNIGMVFSDAWFIQYNEKTTIRWSDYRSKLRQYFKNSIQNTDMHRLLLTTSIVPALTVLVRRDVFETVGFFDENLLFEDADMWIRVAKDYPLAYIDQPLAYYRVHGNNLSNNTMFMVRGWIQTLLKHLRLDPYRGRPLRQGAIFLSLAGGLLVHRVKKKLKISKKK